MKPTVIITSATPWDGVVQRPHHVARELAVRGWDVLYVDHPVTLLGPIRNRALLKRVLPKQALSEVQLPPDCTGQLRVLTPLAILPFANMKRAINRLNQRMLASQIRQVVSGPCFLLSNLPSSIDLIPWLHPLASFYDCVDYHAEFGGLMDKDMVNQMEQEMVYACRTIFATADALADRMKRYHRDVRLVPNAADPAHFATTAQVEPHPLLAAIPEPRMMFIGGIASWVNLILLKELAELRPDVQLVMIGPVEADVSELETLPNVHFLGRQPYAELPQFLRGCKATLYAFVDNELTKGVNPLKVYEYIAADKELIATPTQELLKFENYVWFANDAETAALALDEILGGAHKTTPELRSQFVHHHSWQARTTQIEQALCDWLPNSGGNADTDISNTGFVARMA